MLRTRGGGSHVVQANAPPFGVTLAGLFVASVSCNALAASLKSQKTPEFCQRLLHEYGLAQVGLSLCYHH
jgi:hypothetical protein